MGTEVYPRVDAILATKGDGQGYIHEFETDAPIIGTRDGGLVIPRTSGRLWKRIQGEPWLVNPQLAVYGNPPKKGRSRMARRRRLPPRGRGGRFRKRRRGTSRKRSYTRRSRRRRRNPPMAAAPARRRRASNPRFGMFKIPPMAQIGYGVVGMAASRALPDMIQRNFFPGLPVIGVTGLLVRAGTGMLLGHFVGRFMGRRAGDDVTLGALLGVADDAFSEYVMPNLPGMNAYLDRGGMAGGGMQAYLSPGLQVQDADIVPMLPMASDATVSRLNAGTRL